MAVSESSPPECLLLQDQEQDLEPNAAGATKWVWLMDGDREPKRCYPAFPLVGLGQEHISLPLQIQTEAVPIWGKGGAGNVQPKVKVPCGAKAWSLNYLVR